MIQHFKGLTIKEKRRLMYSYQIFDSVYKMKDNEALSVIMDVLFIGTITGDNNIRQRAIFAGNKRFSDNQGYQC